MEGDVVTSFRESIEISVPPQLVWDLITDIRRHADFAGPKSITKVIDFDGPVAVGSRWVAHEKFGPQRFDAPSVITAVDQGKRLEWVSFPPMKEDNAWVETAAPVSAGACAGRRSGCTLIVYGGTKVV